MMNINMILLKKSKKFEKFIIKIFLKDFQQKKNN